MKLFMETPAAFRVVTQADGRKIALPCDGKCQCAFCRGMSTADKFALLHEAQKALDEQAAIEAAKEAKKKPARKAKK